MKPAALIEPDGDGFRVVYEMAAFACISRRFPTRADAEAFALGRGHDTIIFAGDEPATKSASADRLV